MSKGKYNYKHIILAGMPASGKSSVGTLLADKLERNFYDTDAMLEQEHNMDISAIFASKGENIFRKYEADMLRRVLTYEAAVIALGGGAVLASDNRKVMQDGNLIIYLRASVATLVKNLGDNNNRPLIKPQFNKEEQLRGMLGIREDIYQDCADIVIAVDDISAADVAVAIENEIEEVRRA